MPSTGLGDEQLWISATNDNTGTSTAFDDQSGQGNNGTAVGALVVADTSSGGTYAFDFNGTSDYIDISGFATNLSAYSVSMWVNGTGPNQTVVMYNTGTSLGDRASNVGLQPAGTALAGHQRSGSSYWADSTSTVNGAGWKHVLYTYKGSTVEIFVDGVSEDTQSAPDSNVSQTIAYIGRWVGSTPFWMTGKMDDIRVYNRALTQAEITHLASQRGVEGSPFVGLGDEKLWLCPSIQDSANDLSGNGNNGTYQNGMGTITDTAEGGSLAYDFDGVGDCISNSSLDLRNLPAMSWSAWVRDDKTSGASSFFSHGLGGNFADDTYFFQNGGDNQFQVNRSGDGSGSATRPTSSTWNHLAVVFDGSGAANNNRLRYFVNGIEVALSYNHTVPATTGNPSSSSTRIGDYVSAAGFNLFVGRQDDIRVYDRALTQSEITHLSTARGIEGRPFDGLGDEQLWLCPSLDNSPNDISGNNNNGVYNGGMGTVADTSEGGSLAYDFDGVGDYISNSSLSLAGLTEFSYSGWLNASTSVGLRAIFSHGDNLDYNNDIYILNNYSSFQVELNNGSAGNGSASLYALNTWHHLAVVFDGSGATNADRLRYFLNGVEVTLTYNYTVPTSTSSVSSLNTEIGSFASYGAFHFWQGKQDDIRVYNRALTQAEITHLASQRGVLGPAGGPPASVFFNPFKSQAFHTLTGKRIR